MFNHMEFTDFIRLMEIMLGLAFIQASMEHLIRNRNEQILFGLRICLAVGLIGFANNSLILLSLLALGIVQLHRFQGPYNGGSDRMSLLVLMCLTLINFIPSEAWQTIVLGYLAVQLTLSDFVSGWVKITNKDWRTGRALSDVFAFSAYPVSEQLRQFSNQSKLMAIMSWSVMGFELLFPLALLNQTVLFIALMIAALFHLANAFLFWLNRFFGFGWLPIHHSFGFKSSF
jgi:hypothetical protein